MVMESNTDQLLTLAMQSLGGECFYIHNDSRWMNYRYKNVSFSAFSTRFPFDDPRRICEIDNKLHAKSILADANIPLIPWQLITHGHNSRFDSGSAESWVIKPVSGSKGNAVVTNLSTEELLAFVRNKPSGLSIVEPYISGRVFRVLLLKNRILGAYEKMPPTVIGDGKSTLQQLVRNYVKSVEVNFQNGLSADYDIERTIRNKSIDLGVILRDDEELVISNVNNICRGSAWKMLSIEELDDHTLDTCITAAQATNLNLVGVDLLLSDSEFYILETNPSPGIYGHSIKLDSVGSIELIDLTVALQIIRKVVLHLSPNMTFDPPEDTLLPYSTTCNTNLTARSCTSFEHPSRLLASQSTQDK